MTKPIDLAALARLCDEATPGPWTVELDDYRALSVENAAFIAAARTAVPALLAEVTALRGEVERMRRDARFADAECNESSWLRESELDRLAETGSPSRRVLVDNRELAMLVAEARDHRLLRTQHERMRALDVEAAKAWRDASLDVEGQAWREQRALVAAIDALAKGEP